MAGLYFHIPYCRQACSYCDFYFSTNLGTRSNVLEAMKLELQNRREEWPNEIKVDTLYFGGGTPSLLSADELGELIETAHEVFPISDLKEVTVECNPDDVVDSWVQGIKGIGVTRLSIGVQTFNNDLLKLMNRVHNSEEAELAIESALKGKFHSNTVDLIYGIPGQSLDDLRKDLEKLLESGIEHISAYALTVEERTALAHRVNKGEVVPQSEEDYFEHFKLVSEVLRASGFEHYELSNFAKPGFKARHNSSYWSGDPYLGFGPSAHSYVDGVRSWNVANNHKYISEMKERGRAVAESEQLTEKDLFNEKVMTSLRTAGGIESGLLNEEGVARWRESGHLKEEDGRMKLTLEGMFISDSVISDFFRN